MVISMDQLEEMTTGELGLTNAVWVGAGMSQMKGTRWVKNLRGMGIGRLTCNS